MPSLRSFGPTVNPESSLCTTNTEIPLTPLSGSVTAITVYQVDLPPLVIQHLEPLSTHSSPSARARVRIAAGVTAGLAIETVDKLFADAHLDWRDAEQIRFVLDVGPLA